MRVGGGWLCFKYVTSILYCHMHSNYSLCVWLTHCNGFFILVFVLVRHQVSSSGDANRDHGAATANGSTSGISHSLVDIDLGSESQPAAKHGDSPVRRSPTPPEEDRGSLRIAAIDNGLSFPFKHPDSWRTCKPLSVMHKLVCFSMCCQ